MDHSLLYGILIILAHPHNNYLLLKVFQTDRLELKEQNEYM